MRNHSAAHITALLTLTAMSLMFVACEQKTINQIMAEPERYTRHEVGVVGKVVHSYSVLGRGAYEIDDGTGRLWVVSSRGVPRQGARVGVRGKIMDGYNLGDIVRLPRPIRSGLVMIESEHRAR